MQEALPSLIMKVFTSGFRSLVHSNNPILSTKAQTRFFVNTSSKEKLSQSPPISEKFASFLDNCSVVFTLRKLHACIFAQGLGDSIFLGSKLLNCYAKFGLLAESRWVFDRIINNNLSLWNSILVGYFRTGHCGEVLRRYSYLRERKIGLDSSAITFSLKSCIELGSLEFGRGVHVDAFKFGLNAYRFVGSSLIGLYCRHGDIEDASRVFDEIADKDVVVYTSMITGYAQCSDHRGYGAFCVARRMQNQQLDPNRVTLVSLLQAAAHLEALEVGRSIHAYSIRRSIVCSDEVFETSLMDMYIKCGALRTAACIFGKMDSKTIGSWNAMIAGHLQMEQPFEAFNLFCQMVQEDLMPDLITLANGILCCATLKCLLQGKSIHGYIIRTGVDPDLVAITALVDLYCKCNSLIQARGLFDSMEKRDAISYNVMMTGYLQNEFAFEAMMTFIEMVKAGIKPNISSIVSVLSASSDLKDIKSGRCLHGYILRHGLDWNTEIANQTIYMYAKCGCMDFARQVFNGIKYKDLVSWTSMMTSYVFHGHADEAIILFRLMQREKLEHDLVTVISLLQAFSQLACVNLAREVQCHLYRVHMVREIPVINSLITTYAKCGRLDMAREVFDHMSKRCLTSWNTMIAAYAMHGSSAEVLKLFDRMKGEKVEPDEVTFTSILTACSHSGLVEEGLQVFRSMKEEYSMIPCEVHYSCMVDLLSRAGQLDEAYAMVKRLPSGKSTSSLGALLAACIVYRNTEIGEVVGRQLLELVPENSSAYSLVSNLYAEGGKWDEVARIRAIVKDKGLKRTPGCSLIELDKQERAM
jgi:pentatricopeptide repeat protein